MTTMNEQHDCDRFSTRHTVLLQARCRKSSWNVFPVELADISQGGCCIVGSGESFIQGESVQLRIANMKPIEGDVRWLQRERVGVEFRVALPSSTADEIGRIYGIAIAPGMPQLNRTGTAGDHSL